MPLIVNINDPYSEGILENCWTYCAQLNLDMNHKIAGVKYHVFKDKAAAYSGKPHIAEVSWEINKEAQPAVYGQPVLVSPYVAPVLGAIDPETGEVEIVTPEQPPVYSDPPLLAQAVPSFDEGLAANAEAYRMLMAYFDAMALTRPDFAGGEVEQG